MIAADVVRRGLELQRAGRLDEAEAIWLEILRNDPNNFGALQMRGIIATRTGRLELAEALLARAVALRPDAPGAHHALGTARYQLGQSDAALASFTAATAARPDFAEAYYSRAILLHGQRRPAEALAEYDTVIALRPDLAEAHANRGAALGDLGRAEEGLASCDRALVLDPALANTHNIRARILHNQRRLDEAVASYDRAITLQPDLVDAHTNRASALANLGDLDAALAGCETALSLQPGFAEAHNVRGSAQSNQGRFEAALTSFDAAIALRPDLAEAHNNRGVILQALGRHEAALESFDIAIALSPEASEAHSNKSMCLLAMGDYERGWRLHEWRWNAWFSMPRRDLPGLPWLGDAPIDGKTILVHAEQGFGDSLQFCRYVPMLAERAAVVLEVPQPLVRLLSGLRGVGQVVASGDSLPRFDAFVPILSLPLAFGTTLETVPASVPYLHADPRRSARWRRRLADLPGRKVGLVWSGMARPELTQAMSIDRRRSVTLDRFAPFGAIPGLCLVSLQKGLSPARPADGMVLHDWTDELDDFADTAALVDALDLVISVDTSVVHLAGALGKPVWVLNRYDQCWRWLRDRSDSPWYPTARLFRQGAPGDWNGVVAEVAAALRVWAENAPLPERIR